MRIAFGGGLTVSAEERWFTEIRRGRAFAGSSSFGPSAGDNSHIQLINPAGSGITVIVQRARGARGSTGSLQLTTHNTNLTNDGGTQANLLAGGSASVAHIRTANNVGVLGTMVYTIPTLVSTAKALTTDWHFELGAGEGIVVVPSDVNVGCFGLFEWIEL